ncbi:histidine kinase [Lederbergia sp. NSJ-179]|uniref:sensor histidine kinase n=1 Tax=Lederbergia sp. NSJ-179 TaxID=2931402 RepID=UPI001FD000D7|nr:histidine kinase [Lederbergia sp. NSJ-179]MCJ7843376.1 histidine kinase [Lederbergia sp. NSJ-179]
MEAIPILIKKRLKLAIKSSKNIIIFNYVIIALTMIFSVIVSNYIQQSVNNKYHQFMNKNEEVTKLPVIIEESKKSFQRFLKDRNQKDLQTYHKNNREIARILKLIEEDSTHDTETLIFYGSLNRMFEYQTNLANKISSMNSFGSETYEEITYLFELFKYMVSQANHLLTSYLKYSSQEYNTLFQNSKQLELKILVNTIFLGGISIVVGIYLSKGIFLTISNLSRKAKLLSNGQWDTEDLERIPYRELDNVVQAFNQMKHNIKNYIEELQYKSEIEKQLKDEKLHSLEQDRLLKKSQIEALQMQMNPHFLFNTLNMIGRTIKLNQSKIATKLIESMAKILRYNMEKKADKVLIKDELNVLYAYVYIQQLRFQDRIEISISGESPVLHAEIQPMILQPLVENAIIHGLSDIIEGGKIEIRFSQNDDNLLIIVKDNGGGMSQDRIKEILKVDNFDDRNRGIGLGNIKKRLFLQYEENFTFNIKSSIGNGTEIELIIPLKVGDI